MAIIWSFPTNVGMKQDDWVGALLGGDIPDYVEVKRVSTLPSDLQVAEAIVVDGAVYSIWKRVIIPRDSSLGYTVIYLTWRLSHGDED